MLIPSFIGPAYRTRSETIAADALVNLFLETTGAADDPKHATVYGTPGLRSLLTVSDLGCRGGFAQDGRAWAVIGGHLYEIVVALRTATLLGTIQNDGAPVSFASNGRGGEQLAIVGGGKLYILNLLTTTLSGPIALPLTNASQVVDYIDGYFVLSERDTVRVWFSALEDGTSWNALDFFARSETSDNVVGLKVLRDRIWVFGSITSEVFYNSGDANTPFVPYPGSVMHEGAVTPWAIVISGESLVWLAQDDQGRNRMVAASDYAPTTISTPPISFALASYGFLDDCEVLAYEQEGHAFVAFTFPSALGGLGVTWCVDMTEGQWHQRASYSTALGVEFRWRARGILASDDLLVVGDYATGDLYVLDLDTFTDNGAVLRRRRRAPYLSAENQWMFVDSVELGAQVGVGLATGQGVAPKVELRLSRNNGHTFHSAGYASVGAQGAYGTRVVWRKLGRVRADRLVLETIQSDPVRCVWGPGVWLKASAGSGDL